MPSFATSPSLVEQSSSTPLLTATLHSAELVFSSTSCAVNLHRVFTGFMLLRRPPPCVQLQARAAPPPAAQPLGLSPPQPRRRSRVRCAAAEGSGDAAEVQAALKAAVSREDYAEAALLRDRLTFLLADTRQGIEAANARFYSAFERMSAAEMANAWGTGDHVRCTHPGAACIVGRQEVLESWALVFQAGGKLRIRCEEVNVYAQGAMGFLTCTEVVEGGSATGRLACTNVFERGDDAQWRLVHHHACPAPRL